MPRRLTRSATTLGVLAAGGYVAFNTTGTVAAVLAALVALIALAGVQALFEILDGHALRRQYRAAPPEGR